MAGKSGNLTPLTERAPEEARAIRAEGGRKSGEARRKKKEFRERAKMILELRPRLQKKLMREWENLGYDIDADGFPTVAERLAMSLARRAEDGDDNAFRLLMSYSHNPTMSEKLRADEIKALAEKNTRVDVAVTRQDENLMEGIRALLDEEKP